jgi:hypothetical protein
MNGWYNVSQWDNFNMMYLLLWPLLQLIHYVMLPFLHEALQLFSMDPGWLGIWLFRLLFCLPHWLKLSYFRSKPLNFKVAWHYYRLCLHWMYEHITHHTALRHCIKVSTSTIWHFESQLWVKEVHRCEHGLKRPPKDGNCRNSKIPTWL